MADGARDALLGYLYQFISVASLRALSATSDGTELSAVFLGKVANGRLLHEAHGQDALVRPVLGVQVGSILVQFKHSADPANLLERDELLEILWALDRSRAAAEANGETIEEYVLITNRKLAPDAEALYANRASATRPAGMKPNATYRGQPTKTAQSVGKEYPSLDDAADAWFEVLKRLTIFQQRALVSGLNALRTFATRHGVTADEWSGRLQNTLGALLTETASGEFEVDLAWIRRHLVGAVDARPLEFAPGSILDEANAAVAARLLRQTPLGDGRLVRRELLLRLHEESTRTSVVFILGEGGCGKSVLVLQYMGEQGKALLAVPLTADDASEDRVLATVAQFRSPSGNLVQDPSLAKAVLRLRAANASASRLLLINLDGLEEPFYVSLAEIKGLVSRCSGHGGAGVPGVILLISCRSREGGTESDILELIARLFDCEDPEALRDQVGVVAVTDFDDRELSEAATVLGGNAGNRLAGHLVVSAGGVSPVVQPTGPSTISEQVVSSLKHPVVWGAFAKLADADRMLALTGDPIALDQLAGRLLARFELKCRARREALVSAAITGALEGVAKATAAERPPHSRLTHWIPAVSGVLSSGEAEFLFTEAATYGLIRRESPDAWRWRHAFVAERLMKGKTT